MINVIIPVLNEESLLLRRKAYFERLKKKARLIFVDGGSSDKTVSLAAPLGEVITSSRGKASQKNAGAGHAGKGHLLFLNADCLISEKVLAKIDGALTGGYQGGSLRMRIAGRRKIFRIMEWCVNTQGDKFGIFDADLGFFIDREAFQSRGGFPPAPCMEDILFSLKARKNIKTVMLPDTIYVSPRKWQREGFLRTFLCYLGRYVRYRFFSLPAY